MNILLISTNQIKPTDSIPWVPVPPLGLAYVASSLKRAGYHPHLLDLCFSHDPAAAVADALEAVKPDVVGVSFRNVETMAYFNNISFVEELKTVVDVCRRRSAARIILGGSGFSIMPVEIMKATGADFGIVGEGEKSFPELLTRLAAGSDPFDIPGVTSVLNGRIRWSEPSRNQSVADIPLPDRDMIDHERYVRAGGTANVQTKRGCPFDCVYCTYPLIEGKKVRCRPARQVADEFRQVRERYGVNNVYIVDNQFNYPLSHAESVCEELIALRDDVNVRWECMMNPGFVSEKLVLLMKTARCKRVDLSIETASETMLRNLRKNFTKAQISSAVTLLKQYKIPFDAWILFGGPGERAETVRETLEFLAALEVPDVLFSIGLRVCPATRLAREMRRAGEIDDNQDYLCPLFYLSLNPHEIVETIKPFCAEHKGWRIAAFDLAADV